LMIVDCWLVGSFLLQQWRTSSIREVDDPSVKTSKMKTETKDGGRFIAVRKE
jgi:hypothetical protein